MVEWRLESEEWRSEELEIPAVLRLAVEKFIELRLLEDPKQVQKVRDQGVLGQIRPGDPEDLALV